MRVAPLAFLVVALPVAGCGSYAKDVETICGASRRVELSPGADPALRGGLIGDYLSGHVHTEEGRKLMTAIAQAERGMKPTLLLKEAQRVGLTSCPLAEEWTAGLAATPPPPAPSATASESVRVEITGPGGPEVAGPLDPHLVELVVKRHTGEIRSCYEKPQRKLAGTVVIKFTISEGGRVSRSAVASSTLGDPATEGCIQHRFESFLFPKLTGARHEEVKYPLLVESGD